MDEKDQSIPSYIFVPNSDDCDDQSSSSSIALGSVTSQDEMDPLLTGNNSLTRWAEESDRCASSTTARIESFNIRRGPPTSILVAEPDKTQKKRSTRRTQRLPVKSTRSSCNARLQTLSDMAAMATTATTLKRQGSHDQAPKAPRRRGSMVPTASVHGALAA